MGRIEREVFEQRLLQGGARRPAVPARQFQQPQAVFQQVLGLVPIGELFFVPAAQLFNQRCHLHCRAVIPLSRGETQGLPVAHPIMLDRVIADQLSEFRRRGVELSGSVGEDSDR